MRSYIYAFNYARYGGSMFFEFPKFSFVTSAMTLAEFAEASEELRQEHANDAAITALQSIIETRADVPQGDNPSLTRADGFVRLTVPQAMKIELYGLYKANDESIREFAQTIEKSDVLARRLLNLRHPSWASELELAIAAYGKRLFHSWDLMAMDAAPMQKLPRRQKSGASRGAVLKLVAGKPADN